MSRTTDSFNQPTTQVSAAAEHSVVIAGGGPVGLSVALELVRHGVRPLVLEQRARGHYNAARANLTNLRSMEHFRRWGVADRLRDNDPVGPEFARSCTWVTALNGHVVTDFVNVFDFDEPLPFGGDRPEWAPNPGIEKTLQEAADEHPDIEVRYGATVKSFEQDDDQVTVTYNDADGDETRVQGQYLVAAAGSRSTFRRDLGIRMQGHPDLVQASIWHIHAPGLKQRTTVGLSSFYFFINEHRDAAMLIAQDSDDHYMFMLIPATEGVDPDNWEATRELLFRNVGFEFDVTPVSGGRVRVHSLLAPQFRCGRVLLAGDCAHLISPMGGFGMNLGISDAANLGWKLGAVIAGWGGPGLLDSYGPERSMATSWIQQECIDNTVTVAPQFVEDGISAQGEEGDLVRRRVAARIMETKTKEFVSLGGQLGYHYQDSSNIVGDGTEAPPCQMADYIVAATPGCRAPHVWLSTDVSLYDRFGPALTLLKLGSADTSAIEKQAADRGIPLTVIEPNHGQLHELYGAELVLVRPDHHVAWRGDKLDGDAGAVLETICGWA